MTNKPPCIVYMLQLWKHNPHYRRGTAAGLHRGILIDPWIPRSECICSENPENDLYGFFVIQSMGWPGNRTLRLPSMVVAAGWMDFFDCLGYPGFLFAQRVARALLSGCLLVHVHYNGKCAMRLEDCIILIQYSRLPSTNHKWFSHRQPWVLEIFISNTKRFELKICSTSRS